MAYDDYIDEWDMESAELMDHGDFPSKSKYPADLPCKTCHFSVNYRCTRKKGKDKCPQSGWFAKHNNKDKAVNESERTTTELTVNRNGTLEELNPKVLTTQELVQKLEHIRVDGGNWMPETKCEEGYAAIKEAIRRLVDYDRLVTKSINGEEAK